MLNLKRGLMFSEFYGIVHFIVNLTFSKVLFLEIASFAVCITNIGDSGN